MRLCPTSTEPDSCMDRCLDASVVTGELLVNCLPTDDEFYMNFISYLNFDEHNYIDSSF